MIIDGLTVTVGAGGATAAQIAEAIATETTVTDAAGDHVVTGALASYSGKADGNQLTLTADAAGNLADLTVTGTAKSSAAEKKTVFTILNDAGAGDKFFISIDGVTINAFSMAGAAEAELADAINAYIGKTVADGSAAGTLTITGDYRISVIAELAASPGTASGFASTVAITAAVADTSPTLKITDGVAAVAGSYAGDTVSASNFVGATSYVNELSESKVTFSSVPATAEVTIQGNAAVTTGETVANFASSATAPVVNITGGTSGGAVSVEASKASSITINSDGAPLTSTGKIGTNTIGVLTTTGTATSTLTINADSNLTATSSTVSSQAIDINGAATLVTLGAITNAGGNLTSIDASGMTAGGVSVTLPTTITAFTGGAGGDTVTASLLADADAVVDAGAGIDTLVTAPGNIATADLAGAYKGFEALINLGPDYNGTKFAGLFALGLVGTGANSSVTNLDATVANSIRYYSSGATIGNVSIGLANAAGDSDVVSVTLGGTLSTTANNAASIGSFTAAGVETVNLTASAGSTKTGGNATSTVGSFTLDKATAINLKGSSFILSNIATTKAVTIDGSALTGDRAALAKNIVGFTTAGSAKAGSTIIGSDFNDTFTVGGEGSTYQGGAGTDEFSLTAAVLLPDGTTDAVLDGGAGDKDKITITGTQTLTDVHFTNVTNVEALNLNATTAVSVTGLAAGAKSAFADGMTVTSGALANDATYTFGAGLYDKDVTLTLVSAGDGASTADNIAITTGGGDDTVTVTASSWVGAAGAAGLLSVSTGAGDDVISVTNGTRLLGVTGTAPVVINAGTGADKITHSGVEAGTALSTTYSVAAGDSPVDGYDSITGFDLGSNTSTLLSQTLDFDGVALTAYAATAASGYTSATLTVTVSAAGVVSFGGSKATSGLTLAEKIAAVASVVVTSDGDTALFTDGDNTYVFNNDAAGDSLIELVGVTGTALVTANAAALDGEIFIA